MILLDRSQYMRNGDYIPTRLEAQTDAANLLVNAKTQSHPESTVGVSAGTDLLVSPTEDVGKILSAMHGLPLTSSTDDITSAVQVASLALKHRRNKNGSQKIVLFVGTPLTNVDARAMQKVGRQLKKNNVSIDVVAIGELEANEDKLKELVDAANGRNEHEERTCHLVTVPPGVLLSDVLVSSPVLAGGAFAASAAAGGFGGEGGGGGAGGGGGDNFADYGGIDPNMDPELAMALRISMEEERARQEAVAAAAAQEAAAPSGDDAEMADAGQDAAAAMGLSEEDALLQQALAMSMNENEPKDDEDSKPSADVQMDEDDDEDAAMQMALQMSLQAEEESSNQFQDPAFVNELLGTSGVDPNDPEIQEALRKAMTKKDAEKKDDSK